MKEAGVTYLFGLLRDQPFDKQGRRATSKKGEASEQKNGNTTKKRGEGDPGCNGITAYKKASQRDLKKT